MGILCHWDNDIIKVNDIDYNPSQKDLTISDQKNNENLHNGAIDNPTLSYGNKILDNVQMKEKDLLENVIYVGKIFGNL